MAVSLTSWAAWVAVSLTSLATSWATDFAWSATGWPCSLAASTTWPAATASFSEAGISYSVQAEERNGVYEARLLVAEQDFARAKALVGPDRGASGLRGE